MDRLRLVLRLVAFTSFLACLGASAVAQFPGKSGPVLMGRVLSRTSQPIPSVWVMVFDGTTLKSRSLTGDDGRYYIARLENRRYTIVVRKELKSQNLFSRVVTLPLVSGTSFDIKLSQ